MLIDDEWRVVDLMPTIGEERYDEDDRVPYRDGRGSVEEDALRRDLTIGSMLLHVTRAEYARQPPSAAPFAAATAPAAVAAATLSGEAVEGVVNGAANGAANGADATANGASNGVANGAAANGVAVAANGAAAGGRNTRVTDVAAAKAASAASAAASLEAVAAAAAAASIGGDGMNGDGAAVREALAEQLMERLGDRRLRGEAWAAADAELEMYVQVGGLERRHSCASMI